VLFWDTSLAQYIHCIQCEHYSLPRYDAVLSRRKIISLSEECVAAIFSVEHMVCHPRCVFINYVGLIDCRTQLSVVDVCCLLHRYQLHVSALMAISRFNELTKNLGSYIWHASYIRWRGVFIGWGMRYRGFNQL